MNVQLAFLGNRPSVSVVLNVFRRSSNLEAQLKAIAEQTYKVHEILVWENGAESAGEFIAGLRARSDSNLGVWARFSYALNASSDFVWLIDDDAIPGPGWLANALKTHFETGGVIGSRGLRFKTSQSYTLYEEFGPNNPNESIEQVDIVGHNWIFPKNWLGAFWAELPSKYSNPRAGEDIHLSFAAQSRLGVGTFVPPHPRSDRSLWGEQPAVEAEFGQDEHAISQSKDSLRKFEDAYAHYISVGFRPMCMSAEGGERLSDRAIGTAIRLNPSFAHKIASLIKFRK